MADFQGELTEFDQRDVAVIAGSVDTLEHAKETISKLGLTFRVAFGLNAIEFSAATGAFFKRQKSYLHATAFLLNPDGVVSNAIYSTGSIGRLTPADALRLIDHFTQPR